MSRVRFWRPRHVHVVFTRPSVYAGRYYDIGATLAMPKRIERAYAAGGATQRIGRLRG